MLQPQSCQELFQQLEPDHQPDVGDWLVQCLLHCGISHAYGLPGAAIEPLYNSLARAQRISPTKPVVMTVKHESAAAFAAEGYHKVTGKTAICLATAGPGATNLITGLASAKLERTPMLVLTGQTRIKDFAKGAFQDSSRTGLDTVALMEKVCRYSAMVTHPDQLPHKLYTALSLAQRDSPGPVHLSIALDVLRTRLENGDSSPNLPNPREFFLSFPQKKLAMDQWTFDTIMDVLVKNNQSQKVSILVGPQCQADNVIAQLLEAATLMNWDLFATPSAKGLIPHNHPCFQGIIGFAGHAHAYSKLLADDRALLLIGTPFDESSTGGWDVAQLPFDKVIQLDNNPQNIFSYLPVHIRCLCDLSVFSAQLLQSLKASAPLLAIKPSTPADQKPPYINEYHWDMIQNGHAHCSKHRIKPQQFFWRLNQLAGPTIPICADSSSPFMWSIHLWQSQPFKRVHGENNFHLAMTLATMGWAIGASLGVAHALQAAGDNSPCLCITGDGSYLMSSQEIGTAIQHNLKIGFFILNNSSYGIVEHCQKLVGAEPIAYELPEVDYSILATAFGVPGFRITNTASLGIAWQSFMQTEGPAIFDIMIDPDEVPPLGHRLESLGFAGTDPAEPMPETA